MKDTNPTSMQIAVIKSKAIDAVQRHGIIHPTCLMNPGCHSYWYLIETKYLRRASSLEQKIPACTHGIPSF